MIRKHWSVALLVACMMLTAAGAGAVTIGLSPVSQTVLPGDSVEVALTISGLGNGVAPSLGAFDLDVEFDPAVLGFSMAVFGDPILGDQLDLFGLGSFTGVDASIPATVNLFEVSLDLPADLDLLQAPSFTLATLTFQALAAGVSPLSLRNVILGDALGDPLDASVTGASVNVVPEPGTLLLLGSGLMGFGAYRRRHKC